MTVHVHASNQAIHYGDHHHAAPEDLAETDRTWSFSCTPDCEARVMKDVEHTAPSAAGVPLTVAEKQEADVLEKTARKDVSMLAMALGELAKGNKTAA